MSQEAHTDAHADNAGHDIGFHAPHAVDTIVFVRVLVALLILTVFATPGLWMRAFGLCKNNRLFDAVGLGRLIILFMILYKHIYFYIQFGPD